MLKYSKRIFAVFYV